MMKRQEKRDYVDVYEKEKKSVIDVYKLQKWEKEIRY